MFGSRRATYAPFLMEGLKESMSAIAPYAGPVTSIAGTLMQYQGARSAGSAARTAAEFEAAQLDQNAGQQQAAAQRKSLEEQRKARLVMSRAQVLAAKGGDASSPGVVDIISDIAEEGAYRSALALFEGDDRARAFRMKAAGTRYTGEATERGYKTQATSSLFRGIGAAGNSLFAKYARNAAPVGGFPGEYGEPLQGAYG